MLGGNLTVTPELDFVDRPSTYIVVTYSWSPPLLQLGRRTDEGSLKRWPSGADRPRNWTSSCAHQPPPAPSGAGGNVRATADPPGETLGQQAPWRSTSGAHPR